MKWTGCGRAAGSKRNRLMILFALVPAVWGMGGIMFSAHASESSLVGKKCPEVRGTDFEGKEVVLPSKAKGKVEVVNFWGIRCGSCLEEMPTLEDLQRRYRERGLSVYGVNADGAPAATVAPLLKKMDIAISYRLVADPEFKIMDAFQVTATPLTLIVDEEGKIVYQHGGYEKGDEKKIEAALSKVLGLEGK